MFHPSYLKPETREAIMKANTSTPMSLKESLNRAYTETATCIRINKDKTDKTTREMVARKRVYLSDLAEQLQIMKAVETGEIKPVCKWARTA